MIGFIGAPSLPELLIIGFVVLLLFGKRLPSVMHSVGRSIVEFKKGVKNVQDEDERPELSERPASSAERNV